ncbi:disease resistance protein SUMM2-like isoform X2 [Lotus japonicus]|uniref:disease resistance protein SUMM2-like isoform X2 n=1 Tax=Lotus japonicus TaxID=34305 RepID=UPI0025887B0E|nr:disease resistance protein SUMM2-like isoform X2 [Lotus japonicus]XP_057431772.1 disease resistance protein SUMM2-like isoform X2 [Lotus japonicus]
MKVTVAARRLGNMVSNKRILESLRSDVQDLWDKSQWVRENLTWDFDADLQIQRLWMLEVDEILGEATALLSTYYEAKGSCIHLWRWYRLNNLVLNMKQRISQLYQAGAKFYNPISRTELIDEIMAALKNPSIQTVGVCGLGGGGTTTLAKQVGEQVKKQGWFYAVLIITIVEEPNVEQIQKDIGSVLGLQFHDETRVERRNQLRQRIKNVKKILVLVDDIWGEMSAQKFNLEEFGVPLGDEHKGCKLLLTSGNLDFIKNMRGDPKVFQLEVLLEDEALSLFDRILGSVAEDSNTRSLKMEIVESCAGSALSTSVIAKSLRNKGLGAWQDALKQLKQHVPPIIICLNSLQSEEHKYLFLLLTIQGRRAIHKSRVLFDMWTGLFENLGTLEDARNKLDSLISDLMACGLVVEDRKEWIKIVDMIWEAAYSVARRVLQAVVISRSWPPLERMRIFRFCNVTISSGYPIPERLPCPALEKISLHTQSPLMQVPDSFFEETKLLKVMEFVGFDCSKLPRSIGLLKDIQVLSMSNCKLGDITIVQELTSLQMLSLLGSRFEQLPKQFGQLQKLRLLDLRDTYLQVIPPNALGNLTSLEELYLRNSFSNWEVERSKNGNCCASLKELTNLHRLTHIEDLYVPDHEAWPMDLYFEKLKSYTIFIGDGWGHSHDGDHGLKTLKLKLNKMFQSEEGIKKMLKVVDVLYLDELNGVQNVLSDLGCDGFPYLHSLVVQHNAEIKCIAMSSSHPLDDVFPNLESLSLYKLSNLEHICHGLLTEKSFFNLRIIKVHKCDEMSYLFSKSMIKCFPHLVDIEISECKCIKAVLAEYVSTTKFPKLRYLTLQGLPELMTFSYNFLYSKILFDGQLSLDKLKVLRAINLDIEQLLHYNCSPKLLCELEELTLSDNNKLLIAISDSSLIMRYNNLKILTVDRCKSLTTIFYLQDDKPDQAIEAMFHQLMAVELRNLCSLRQIWYMDLKVPFFQSLKSLHIVHCGNLKSVFSLPAVKNLTQLKLLKLYNCEKLIEVIEGDEVGNLPITFPEVECLILKDLPNMVHFYGQSKRTFNCPKLQTIRVKNIRSMVTFCDGHLNTPMLRTVSVSFVKRCWHGDLNNTIRHLNGYAAFNNITFFEDSPDGFSFKDLHNASYEVLGKGSLGTTYKATLDDGTKVVVKKLIDPSKEKWQKLASLRSMGRHPNVMPLQAYYNSIDEMLLVYPYMPRGSLFSYLHGNKAEKKTRLLDWNSKVNIALGVAKGIAFIHSKGGPNFTHGNLKSTNVFFTQNLDDACISDVRLTSQMNDSSSSFMSKTLEVTNSRQITQGSDVYSFSAILVQILTLMKFNWILCVGLCVNVQMGQALEWKKLLE